MTDTIIASDTTWGEFLKVENVGVTYPDPGPGAAHHCHDDEHDGQEETEDHHNGDQVSQEPGIGTESLQ